MNPNKNDDNTSNVRNYDDKINNSIPNTNDHNNTNDTNDNTDSTSDTIKSNNKKLTMKEYMNMIQNNKPLPTDNVNLEKYIHLMNEMNKAKVNNINNSNDNTINQSNPIHLLIATPAFGSQIYTPYVESLIQTCGLLSVKNIRWSVKFINNQLVTRARNMLSSMFLENKDFTHMIFIDADIMWNPIDILKLLSYQLECVVGVYPNKGYFWKDDKLIMQPSSRFMKTTNVQELKHPIHSNLIKMNQVATGFMLLTKSALLRIKHEVDYFYLDNNKDTKIYNYFDCNVVNHDYLTEDYYFSYLFNKNGGEIYADMTIKLMHFGPHGYGSLIKN